LGKFADPMTLKKAMEERASQGEACCFAKHNSIIKSQLYVGNIFAFPH
jgi:hypothetical protein